MTQEERQAVQYRGNVEWVPINEIVPNPLNPRKNDAIRTEEMQEIILNRGWEEPLTVYKKGKMYVVLAGHRRLYAAKQTRTIKEIPVYVVDTPENHQEEIERIASLQRGRVDWSSYEWAKFTHERWIAWGRPTFEEFSKKSKIPKRTVAEYITVLEYYPRDEIEAGLQTEVYSMSALASLVDWMKKFNKYKPGIVASLTEEMIRNIMLTKMKNKHASRDALRKAKPLFETVSDKDVVEFLTNTAMSLQDLLDLNGITSKKRTFHGRLVSIGIANRNIKGLEIPYNNKEKETLLENLKNLEDSIKSKIAELSKAQT